MINIDEVFLVVAATIVVLGPVSAQADPILEFTQVSPNFSFGDRCRHCWLVLHDELGDHRDRPGMRS